MTPLNTLRRTFLTLRLLLAISLPFLRFYIPFIITSRIKHRHAKKTVLKTLKERGLTDEEAEKLAEIAIPSDLLLFSPWEVLKYAEKKEDR